MTPNEQHEEEIFAAALERPAAERQAFVRGSCEGDAALQAAVRALLAAHDKAEDVLERPITEHLPEFDWAVAPEAWIGKRIGPFVLEHAIATGGMGTVYQAVQDHPRRQVALKITTSGLLSEASLRRFRYEAEILGRLRHPGIAHVYEAGVHEEGALALPYIAMELIDGAQTIVDHARRAHLTLEPRLSLFARVCEAVHHGHVKGVIHRDLKPGNILIDPDGNPKVIDFGVARAADAELAHTKTLTLAGQVVGTLPYMSPEQCGDDPGDVDVRSDVYSLGVLLFELLTGELPHAVEGHGITRAIACIRNESPRRPSSLEPALRGDLETILLKALETDRERRYHSAQELGADVLRFLRREPIAARPASTLYQLRMFSRRHRELVVGLGALLVVLVVATGVSAGFAVQASNQRDAAESARGDEAVQRGIAEEVSDFLRDVLAAARPNRNPDGDLTVRQVLDEASERLAVRTDLHPLVETGIRETLGRSYAGLGRTEAAAMHLGRALELLREQQEPEHPDVGRLLSALAENHSRSNRLDAAHEAATRALAILAGADSEYAVPRIEANLTLARVHRARDEFADAEEDCRRALSLCPELTDDERELEACVRNNLAALFLASDRIEPAKQEIERAMAIARDLPSAGRVSMATQQSTLGQVLFRRGDVRGAGRLWNEALAVFRNALPQDHPFVATALSNLAMTVGSDEAAKAIEMEREALEIRQARFPDGGPEVARSLDKLAWYLIEAGEFDEAEAKLRDSLAQKERLIGTRSHPEIAQSLEYLGLLETRRGRAQLAVDLLAEAVDIVRATRRPGNDYLPRALSLLALARTAAGDAEGAATAGREAWELRVHDLPEGSWLTANSASIYGGCLVALRRYDEARPLLVEALHLIAREKGPADQRTREAYQRVAQLAEASGNPDLAAAQRAWLDALGQKR